MQTITFRNTNGLYDLQHEALYLEKELTRLQQFASIFAKMFKHMQRPVKKFEHTYPLKKDQWHVITHGEGKGRIFELVKTGTYVVDTKSAGWRLSNAFYQTKAFYRSSIYHVLISNLENGPLGLRSLFSKEKFHHDYIANEEGQIVPNPYAIQGTLASRLKGLKENRDQILQNFHERGSYGFLGKGWERFLLGAKVDLGQWLLPSMLLSVFQPIGTVANTILSTGYVSTAFLWAPLTTFLRYGFNTAIYDLDGTQPRLRRIFPLINNLLVRTGVEGLLQTTVATGGISLIPSFAVARQLAVSARAVGRTLWDKAWHTLISRVARVPDDDSVAVKRIAGPGISREYFFQVKDPSIAVLAVLALAEQTAVVHYRHRLEDLIAAPGKNLLQAIKPYLFLAKNPELSSTTFQNIFVTAAKRKRALEKNIYDTEFGLLSFYRDLLDIRQRERIKMTEKDLTQALDLSAVVLEKFFQNVFKEDPTQETSLWGMFRRDGVEPKDWKALARVFLRDLWGENVLTSLEKTDETMVIQVQNEGLSRIGADLLKGYIHDDLDVASIQGTVEPSPVKIPPQLNVPLKVTVRDLCQPLLMKDSPMFIGSH